MEFPINPQRVIGSIEKKEGKPLDSANRRFIKTMVGFVNDAYELGKEEALKEARA